MTQTATSGAPTGATTTAHRWITALSVRAADRGLALTVFVVSMLLSGYAVGVGALDLSHPWLGLIGLQAAQSLPLIWRRSNPALMGVVLLVASAAQLAVVTIPLSSNVAVAIGVYSVTRWATEPGIRLAALGSGLLAAAAASLRWPIQLGAPGVAAYFVFLGGVIIIAWLAGELSSRRDRFTAGIEEQNRILQREREQAERLAAATERNAIARELHDVLAHSLALIAVQAEGAAFASRHRTDDARWDDLAGTMGSIADVARDSLAETRRAVFRLRDTEPETTPTDGAADTSAPLVPTPDLRDVDTLCRRMSDAGRTVALTRRIDVTTLDDDVSRAAYRIVQESLTNVLKHASADAAIAVTISQGPSELVIEVSNTGDGSDDVNSSATPGSGLMGMSERARMVGGRLDTGATDDGGFVVRCVLPTVAS